MYLSYTPETGDPQRWHFAPAKMKAAEAEAIEKRTGWDWGEFGEHLLKGSVLARRALLWTFLRRVHQTLRFEDVDFSVDELTLELEKSELINQRDQLVRMDVLAGPEKATALAMLDEEIDKAPDGPGKASASNDV